MQLSQSGISQNEMPLKWNRKEPEPEPEPESQWILASIGIIYV